MINKALRIPATEMTRSTRRPELVRNCRKLRALRRALHGRCWYELDPNLSHVTVLGTPKESHPTLVNISFNRG